ncbi:MAG: thioredoxin domain-containing protein [Candidatus Aenigmarchaeota archaeon]|nr:thioredoxin domain-containing protein [Candidatus Aenigmarchaeota archaeon]MDI6722545.1 thioredoxin domain-containing protein [Candidatus Aenigmarchaeota archaeon]
MVFCIIGIVIFGILGIFSAKYRTYFRESLHCISRQIVLKPCDTEFDNKMKAKISGKIMRISPSLSRFVHKRFALLSWVFIILMISSIAMIGAGVYNWWAYGNCNGPDSSEFCVFNIDTASVSESDDSCTDPSLKRELLPLGPGQGNPSVGPENAKVTVVEFGCYACKYTKKTEPIVKEMLKKYEGKIRFVYRVFPLPNHNGSRVAAEASYCAWEQKHEWKYHDLIFENQKNLTRKKFIELASIESLNVDMFTKCFDESKYAAKIDENYDEGISAGIYGTPTFFIGQKSVVGPKSLDDLARLIDEEMKG